MIKNSPQAGNFLRTFLLASLLFTVLSALGLVPLLSSPVAADEFDVRLAYGRKIHYAPQVLAEREGLFQAQGLKVKSLIVTAGIQSAEALIGAAADVAAMGDAPAVFAVASGRPVSILAAYGGGERMHRIVAAPKSGINGPADLVNRKVAVQRGSSTHGAFLRFLRQNGIDPEKVRIIDLPPNLMPDAMLSGQIEAAVGSEPWPGNILHQVKGSRELTVLSGLGNEFPLVILSARTFAEQHPDMITALLKATSQAVQMINDHPDQSAAKIAEVTGVPPDRELEVLKALEWRLRLDDAVRQSLAQTAAFMKEEGLIRDDQGLAAAFDDRFMKKLAAESPAQ